MKMPEREKWMSTWLHDVWIGAFRPESLGRGECATSTYGVAVATGLRLSWMQYVYRKREGEQQ